jgi:hypothetical protein
MLSTLARFGVRLTLLHQAAQATTYLIPGFHVESQGYFPSAQASKQVCRRRKTPKRHLYEEHDVKDVGKFKKKNHIIDGSSWPPRQHPYHP